MLQADGLLGRGALRWPGTPRGAGAPASGRVLVAQALEELNHSRRGQLVTGEPAQRSGRGLGFPVAEPEETVGELVRVLACGAAGDDLLRETAQVLDQQDAQG